MMSGVLSCTRILPTVFRSARVNFSRRCFWRGPRDPVTDLTSGLRYMEKQMRELDREMSRLFDDVNRLSPFRLPFAWGRERDVPLETPGDKETYRLNLELTDFEPEDIKVTIRNNLLTVEAKKEVKSADGGRLMREYKHQLSLPDDVNPDTVRSLLSPDGTLTIEAPFVTKSKATEIPVESVKNDEKKDN